MTSDLPGHESYRLLFEHNPQPMWVYDLETLRFLTVNEAAVVRYGYTREQFERMRITDIRPPEDVPPLLEAVRAMARPAPLVFASTNKVYGNLGDLPLDEDDARYVSPTLPAVSEARPLDFHTPYGCSKGAAEQYVLDYAPHGIPRRHMNQAGHGTKLAFAVPDSRQSGDSGLPRAPVVVAEERDAVAGIGRHASRCRRRRLCLAAIAGAARAAGRGSIPSG